MKGNDLSVYCEKQIDSFITPESRSFFRRFEIKEDFLKIDPADWQQRSSYQNGLKIVNQLKVVNDVAERGVYLFSEYNNILTNSEEQKQFLVQLVVDYRRTIPDSRKKTIMKHY